MISSAVWRQVYWSRVRYSGSVGTAVWRQLYWSQVRYSVSVGTAAANSGRKALGSESDVAENVFRQKKYFQCSVAQYLSIVAVTSISPHLIPSSTILTTNPAKLKWAIEHFVETSQCSRLYQSQTVAS
jgi:hypothetical protein